MIITQENDTEPLISVVSGKENDLTSNLFEHLRPELLTNLKPCIRYEHGSSGRYMRNYVKGFPIGVEFEPNTHVYNCYGHYPNHFEDVGVLFNIKGSNVSFQQSEWHGLHKVCAWNYNYIFALNGGIDNMHFVFAPGQFQGGTPKGVFVPKEGEWRNGQVGLSALKNRPDRYICPVRKNSFYVDVFLYPEEELSDIVVELKNNSKGFFRIGRTDQNSEIKIDFSFMRGGLFGGGTIILTNKPDNQISQFTPYGDDCGIKFSKETLSETINFKYDDTVAPDGSDTTLRFTVRRQII